MPDKKIIEDYPYITYSKPVLTDQEILERSKNFYEAMDTRRSVREFSDRAVPSEVIDTAPSTAPSGTHKQPWTFCVVSNPEIKKQIRIAAEEEELESYESRMSSDWLEDLKPLGTDWRKPFLETAPYLSSFSDAFMNLLQKEKKTITTYRRVLAWQSVFY
jgi:iodotyrosine deiodinase